MIYLLRKISSSICGLFTQVFQILKLILKIIKLSINAVLDANSSILQATFSYCHGNTHKLLCMEMHWLSVLISVTRIPHISPSFLLKAFALAFGTHTECAHFRTRQVRAHAWRTSSYGMLRFGAAQCAPYQMFGIVGVTRRVSKRFRAAYEPRSDWQFCTANAPFEFEYFNCFSRLSDCAQLTCFQVSIAMCVCVCVWFVELQV